MGMCAEKKTGNEKSKKEEREEKTEMTATSIPPPFSMLLSLKIGDAGVIDGQTEEQVH